MGGGDVQIIQMQVVFTLSDQSISIFLMMFGDYTCVFVRKGIYCFPPRVTIALLKAPRKRARLLYTDSLGNARDKLCKRVPDCNTYISMEDHHV